MRALLSLTLANLRSFLRDRGSVFWTLAFPAMFMLLFGSLFSGGNTPDYKVGWVDEDGTPPSAQLRATFEAVGLLEISEGGREDSLAAMRRGDLRAVIVVPRGYGATVAAASSGPAGAPVPITVFTDPSQQNTSTAIQQIVGQVLGGVNQALSGRPPIVVPRPETVQTERISAVAYFVPSILGMALMQLGVFSAVPLVAQREKLIFKRLAATPLRRWSLVGSNVLVRLLIAAVQTVLIVGIGRFVFDIQVLGNPLLVAAIVVLGATTFIALGYVIASIARTEEMANALTSIVQFPLMFLSGIFFPLEFMPSFLRPVAAVMPLTYLGDALRQVMVGGVPFVPLALALAVLAGWLVVCLAISARFFRWQ